MTNAAWVAIENITAVLTIGAIWITYIITSRHQPK
jgi:hypothetical protein